MKLNQKILNAINEGIRKSLLSFDDVQFDNSENTLAGATIRVKNKLYGFDKCLIGEILYLDDILGYNLMSGKEMGYCVMMAKDSEDGQAKFVYNQPVSEKVQYKDAKRIINSISFNGVVPNAYIPSISEFSHSDENLIPSGAYWTSDEYTTPAISDSDRTVTLRGCFHTSVWEGYTTGPKSYYQILPFIDVYKKISEPKHR